MTKTRMLFLLPLILSVVACGAIPGRPDATVAPVAVTETAEPARVDAVPVEHTFAREIQAENCIKEMLDATHEVDRTAGLTRATQACSSIWLSHDRKVRDWRMIQDYKRDNQDVMPVKLDDYNGSFLTVDFDNAE